MRHEKINNRKNKTKTTTHTHKRKTNKKTLNNDTNKILGQTIYKHKPK